ncbi:PRC-barrel domain protein [Methanofollis liminatans DSM 4140]|uniref:PRC-barrel domain protein n=1 Tax=Methanofollis liminatans DSM 4140 TaxID=28892 RepID=J0S2Q2_9EURY|nr:PRC-barrel domain-containing protein [Methanofollis liminatans]EJG08201.1 PRC-barrel domain protein [Methanofollis liminatans DSM 4140]
MSFASQVTVVYPRMEMLDRILGSSVKSVAEEHLGVIDSLMIDTSSGLVTFGVISSGGILGLGEKYFPVPWQALSREPGQDEYTLKVREETFKNAPSFDRGNPPRSDDLTWFERVYHFYGVEPVWEGGAR